MNLKKMFIKTIIYDKKPTFKKKKMKIYIFDIVLY